MTESITGVEAAAYEIPTDRPEADGTLTWSSTTLVVVTVTAGGERGVGWTYAPAAAAHLVRGTLADVVRGADPLAPATTQAALVRAVRNAGRPGIAATAISAVDIALWDLCGRLHGLPLARLWGATPDPVALYGSGGFTSYAEPTLRAQVESWLALGVGAVKIKIGESWGHGAERDLARTELVRDLVPDGMDVFVDANGGYAVGQAVRMGRRLDALGVAWFEEPVSSDDLAGLRRVREAVLADVTAGEYGFDLTGFERLAAAEAVDCLQVDVTRCGGFTEWRRVTAVAAAHGLDLSAHCAPYLSVAVAALTPRVRHLEYFHDHVRIEQALCPDAPRPADGSLRVADAPGHGLEPGPEIFEEHRVA